MTMLQKLFTLGAFIVATTVFTPHAEAVFFSNGDFETGTLSDWFVEEDAFPTAVSPLVDVVDDGTGNLAAGLFTGFTSDFVTTTTLGRDIGTLDSSALDLLFDFRLIPVGSDFGGGSPFLDTLTISLLTDIGDLTPILVADTDGFTVIDPLITSVTLLSTGYFHTEVDVSAFAGATGSTLFFDLFDEDDAFLTVAQIDNLDLVLDTSTPVIPEPMTLLLLGSGLLASVRLRR